MMPTASPNLTAQGTILGTIQYMAPEQLEGQEADARTDIFAFGAVLYEMLTGRKAFEGKSHASLIAAIMGSEPPAMSTSSAPHATAARSHRQEMSRERARGALAECEGSARRAAVGSPASSARCRAGARPPERDIACAVVVGRGDRGSRPRRKRRHVAIPPQPSRRRRRCALQIVTPDATVQFTLSPDGRSLVFAAGGRLWLRPLDIRNGQAAPRDRGRGPPVLVVRQPIPRVLRRR